LIGVAHFQGQGDGFDVEATSAGALFNTSPLQRCFRDAQGSAQHLVASNLSLDKYGAALLADS
jgi:hypothetical protein